MKNEQLEKIISLNFFIYIINFHQFLFFASSMSVINKMLSLMKTWRKIGIRNYIFSKNLKIIKMVMTISKNKNLTQSGDTLSEIEFKTKFVCIQNAFST